MPNKQSSYSYFKDPERLERLALSKAPDRQKWGAVSSYSPQWAERAQLAAGFIANGERVLEVGVGSGAFRNLVAGRCYWVGTDLQPVLPGVQALNLECDPLPSGPWDSVVILGVLEYIYDTAGALDKLFGASGKLVMTYCLPRGDDVTAVRRGRGWVSDLTLKQLQDHATTLGFALSQTALFNSADDFDQMVLVFVRSV